MSTTIAADPAESVHARQQALQQQVLLLAPSFGYWRGYYQIGRDRAKVALDERAVKDGAVAPRSILMQDDCPVDREGKPWKDRFNNIETAQKRLIERYSVVFPVHGVRIVPMSKGRELFDQLIGPTYEDGKPRPKRGADGQQLPSDQQSIAYQLCRAADEFCNNLGDILRQIRANNPQVWDVVQERVPQVPAEMRKKFYVDAVPVVLAGSGGQEIGLGDLEDHAAIVREAIQRKVEEAIESMVVGPREELADAIGKLQALIERDGRITDRSFNGVRLAIGKIRAFDFVANASLLEEIGKVERRLGITTASTLDRVTAASNGFSAALQSLQAEVTDELQQAEARENFGRGTRRIDLD